MLSQLGTFISGTVCAEYLQLHKYYKVNTTSISASTLAEQIAAVPDPVIILLISGKIVQTGEKAIFGYHLPWHETNDPCFLFELSPVHDVFRGHGPRPGWKIDRDNLVFGESDNGVALVLEKDLKWMTVSHNTSKQNGPKYDATSWRGDWQVCVEVDEIEMWLEV